MEELSDKDFDQIFKSKIKDGYLEFEEESWLKMEKKLRARDRFVFLKYASIILLLLSFGIGFYVISDRILKVDTAKITKSNKLNQKIAPTKIEVFYKQQENSPLSTEKMQKSVSINQKPASLSQKNTSIAIEPQIISSASVPQTKAIDNSIIASQKSTQDSVVAPVQNQSFSPSSLIKHGITLSILVGPDFNSTENAIGGKRGIAVGIGISLPLSKKLSIQTGINYGSKNYEAQGYDYTFNNPNVVNLISGIDASCKVLEIPLRSSYTIIDNAKNSIDLSAGLSSYIMLKENYRFIYTESSGRKDRFLEKVNANQHYLSVIDLSATYNVKLKNKKFSFGIQPYAKIPIRGIGEGNVPLKSSGISLKLNYELIKKN